MTETNANGEDKFDNNGRLDHECEDFSDSDLDEIPDIDDEGTDDGENVYAPSIKNSSHSIVIRNDLRVYMLNVDFDVAYASKCFDIILAHRLAIDPKSEELVEGDARTVISKVITETRDKSRISAFINDIQSLASSFIEIKFLHANRKCNKVAHEIAKEGFKMENSTFWVEEVPVAMVVALEADRCWVDPPD
ncbi:hypothetical protein Gotri_001568 [Gossypium trilobum]|uniref:RNase H type-1 domain-containing protein n=1 Tax=Gossypium trilobum TaxID=34281 RepID=A0A7J9FFJ1_9ROSI|nr:hypothetical protein [Gossypium trilobum]